MLASIVTTVFLGSVIGIVTSISVYGFISLVEFLTEILRKPLSYHEILNNFSFESFKLLLLAILVPSLVGLLVGFIRKYSSDSRWHGPPDVILSVHSEKKPLDIKSGFLTSFSSILSISAGGSVGQYGPLVHFGATLGAEIKNLFKTKGQYQIFVGSGVAGAISSGFGAPLAGLIFAREVILRQQSLSSFAPILVSSIVSYFFTKLFFGFEPLFSLEIGSIESLYHLPFFIITGLITGLVSIIYMKGLTHKRFFPDISKINPIVQPAVAGLICGIFSCFVPEVIGIGTETIRDLVSGKLSLEFVILLLVLKMMLTIICLRLGLIGGVFAPALFLGACVGVIVGFCINFFSPELNLNLLTVASMAAFGSCVIGGPVANMMIILELTSDYQATLASGISIVFASIISYRLVGQSVFDKVLANKDININHGRSNIKLSQIPVRQVCHQNYCKLQENQKISEVIKILADLQNSEGYLLNDKNVLINKIELPILLKERNKQAKIKKCLIRKYLKLDENENILECINKCKDFVGESIPVVNQNKILVGVISEGDLFQTFLKITEEELAKDNET